MAMETEESSRKRSELSDVSALMSPLRQKRDDIRNVTKPTITIKEIKITSAKIISTEEMKKKPRISNHPRAADWHNKEFGPKWKIDIDVQDNASYL